MINESKNCVLILKNKSSFTTQKIDGKIDDKSDKNEIQNDNKNRVESLKNNTMSTKHKKIDHKNKDFQKSQNENFDPETKHMFINKIIDRTTSQKFNKTCPRNTLKIEPNPDPTKTINSTRNFKSKGTPEKSNPSAVQKKPTEKSLSTKTEDDYFLKRKIKNYSAQNSPKNSFSNRKLHFKSQINAKEIFKKKSTKIFEMIFKNKLSNKYFVRVNVK